MNSSLPHAVEANGADPVHAGTDLAPAALLNSDISQHAAQSGMAGDSSATETEAINAEDIALYDRQIRLWGVKAQENIQRASILLINIRGLANEIAKNLVLAGIRSVTLQDSLQVTEEDLGAQFLLSEDDIGRNRAAAAAPQLRKLNPRVTVEVDNSDIKVQGVDYYAAFDVVIATDLDLSTLNTVNAACRLANRPFYSGATHGIYGYIFADLITHNYVIEREKSNRPASIGPETTTRSIIATSSKNENGKDFEVITKRELYSPLLLANTSPLPPEQLGSRRKKLQVPPLLSCLRALWEFQTSSSAFPGSSRADLQLFTTLTTQKHQELQLPPETLRSEVLRSFLQNIGCEIAPVTAFLGGQLAQDVINVLSRQEQPIQNFLLFDGEDSKGSIYALHPIFPEMGPAIPPAMGASQVPAPDPVGANTSLA